jgi:hypothetical protein
VDFYCRRPFISQLEPRIASPLKLLDPARRSGSVADNNQFDLQSFPHNVSPYPQTMRSKSRHSSAAMRYTNICLGIRTKL